MVAAAPLARERRSSGQRAVRKSEPSSLFPSTPLMLPLQPSIQTLTLDLRRSRVALFSIIRMPSSLILTSIFPPQVASKLWAVALQFRFKLPPYFTLVLRNLASLEGIGLTVDPSFKVFASAYPHVVRRLLTENTPATRRVLRTLLTDGQGSVRWDRIAALGAGSPALGK